VQLQTYALNGHLYRVTCTKCHIHTINSDDDGHMAARNMYRIEINIRENELWVKLVIYKDYCTDICETQRITLVVIQILTLILLMCRIGSANNIPIYIQQDATLHSLFISGNYSTCFGWYFHLSSGAHTPVSTASGICHTVTALCRYRGRVRLGHLSVLWVAYTQRYTVYLYLETTLHVSGSTFTHHQERIQLYLQHLVFVTPLLLSAAIVEELEPV
jgi:hypothetical protein